MTRKNLGILLLAFGMLTTNASAELIMNGSFEVACVNPGASFIALFPGNPCITGWTIVAADIHYVGTFWQASDGSRSLDWDGNAGSAGGITQTFATTPGVQYTVRFDLAGNPQNAPTIKPMRVSAAGQSREFTFDITGRSLSNMGWTRHTWSFIADDTSATLEFRSLTSSSGWGPALDNVSVTASPTPPAGIDHFKCYTAKGESVDVTVSLEDQFGVEPQVLVQKPKLFCNPVDKNGEGIRNPAMHLTCYEVEADEDDTRWQVRIKNQFGEQILKVKEPKLLCVPSEKTEVTPVEHEDDDDHTRRRQRR